MANNDTLGPVPEQFDAGKMYRVQLASAHNDGGFVYVPGAQHTVNGSMAESMRPKLVAVSEAD